MEPKLMDYRIEFREIVPLEPFEPDDQALKIEGDVILVSDEDEEVRVGYITAEYLPGEWFEESDWDHASMFDALGQEQATCYEALFGEEGVREAVLQQFSDVATDNVLFISSLMLEPDHRGRGLGLAVLRETIKRFGPYLGLVAMLPHPIAFEGSDEEKLRIQRKLQDYYGRLGFQRVGDSEIVALATAWALPSREEICASLLE